MKPVEGIALGDRYRLVTRIAVGGMGEVWAAHDESLARDVAVKVLREEFAGDEGFLERFRTEARNSAQLSHPNIAQLYDYGEQDGSGFLVMELVLGEPLADLLDREPVLSTRRLLPILAETARALHAAHVAGVVHRDVKPGNILLARSGRVKITDFGISTAINQIPMTDTGMVMGTAQYLSPEQAIGKAATPASDIYSLGIVAYEALVGNRPFTGPTAVDIAVAHVNTPVPPMPTEIEPELSGLVMRMLSKDPEDRPRSAASLARMLDNLGEQTPSRGVPSALGRHTRPVDVVDAITASGLQLGTFPTMKPPPPRPTGQLAQLIPGRDEAIGEPPPVTPPAYTPPAGDPVIDEVPGTPVPAAGTAGTGPSMVRSSPGTGDTGAPGGSRASRAPDRSEAPGRSVAPGTPGTSGTSGTSRMSGTSRASGTSGLPSGSRTPHPPRMPGPPDRSATSATSGTSATTGVGTLDPLGWRLAEVARAVGQGLYHGWHTFLQWMGFVAAGVNRPLPVPARTTTSNRWGRLSWPLVLLVLMVIFALLGAAFMDRLLGPSRAAPAPQGAGSEIVIAACPGAECARGIIDIGPRLQGLTTTARDHQW